MWLGDWLGVFLAIILFLRHDAADINTLRLSWKETLCVLIWYVLVFLFGNFFSHFPSFDPFSWLRFHHGCFSDFICLSEKERKKHCQTRVTYNLTTPWDLTGPAGSIHFITGNNDGLANELETIRIVIWYLSDWYLVMKWFVLWLMQYKWNVKDRFLLKMYWHLYQKWNVLIHTFPKMKQKNVVLIMVCPFGSLTLTSQIDAQYVERLLRGGSCVHVHLLWCVFDTRAYGHISVTPQPAWEPVTMAPEI